MNFPDNIVAETIITSGAPDAQHHGEVYALVLYVNPEIKEGDDDRYSISCELLGHGREGLDNYWCIEDAMRDFRQDAVQWQARLSDWYLKRLKAKNVR